MEDLNLLLALIAMIIVALVLKHFLIVRPERRRSKKSDMKKVASKISNKEYDVRIRAIETSNQEQKKDAEELERINARVAELMAQTIQAVEEERYEDAERLVQEGEELIAIFNSLAASMEIENQANRERIEKLLKENL